ncbi:MAG: YHYH protein [Chthoniobacteraceae bacterium]
MKHLLHHRLPATLGAFVLLATTTLAHPGHEEDASAANAPAFFLAQAGPLRPASVTAAPAGKVENSVSIKTEGDYRVVKSNGWPDHAPGAFPRRGNPNTATVQSYTFRVPLKPKAAATPERRGGWWWGVAVNGVPFEPGTGETWNNHPRSGWRYEAATGFLNLGLDEHNAHVQPTGAYHYHALPTGLVERLGGDGKKMLLVGWAADGFPIYTSWAPTNAKDAKSALRKMKSSYRLKQGARPTQEGGPGGNYDGRFTQDFEFVKDAGDLDECNGRAGVTPEFPEGSYYYCISAEFPFLPRMWRGTPDPSFGKGDGPPGGRPGGNQRPAPFGGPPRGILEGGPGPIPGGSDPGFRSGPPPQIEALDLNKDGVIDAEEIAKAPQSLKVLDKNGDGKLTPDEYRWRPPGASGLGGEPRPPGPPQ